MAKTLEIHKEHNLALYDSATGDSLEPMKAVDMTDDCPAAERPDRRVVFLFTTAKRGRIVQMARPYKGEVYMGSHIHFFVDELDDVMRWEPRDDTFGLWADDLGLSKTDLRKLIEAHAPR